MQHTYRHGSLFTDLVPLLLTTFTLFSNHQKHLKLCSCAECVASGSGCIANKCTVPSTANTVANGGVCAATTGTLLLLPALSFTVCCVSTVHSMPGAISGHLSFFAYRLCCQRLHMHQQQVYPCGPCNSKSHCRSEQPSTSTPTTFS